MTVDYNLFLYFFLYKLAPPTQIVPHWSSVWITTTKNSFAGSRVTEFVKRPGAVTCSMPALNIALKIQKNNKHTSQSTRSKQIPLPGQRRL